MARFVVSNMNVALTECLSGRSLLLAALLAAVTAFGCGKQGAGPGAEAGEGDEHPLVGVKAPDFELAAQHGAGEVSLASVAGKVAIVDFWATWCEPCKQSFPAYEKMQEAHGSKLVVIGISVDDSPDGIDGFAKETGVSFPLAWDEGQAISKTYEPPTMPTCYIVDKHGIVRFVHAGFHPGDESSIESMVSSLMK